MDDEEEDEASLHPARKWSTSSGLHAPVVMTTQRAAAMESIRRWRADAGYFHVMSVAVVRADIPERCLTGDGDLDGLAWSLIGAHAHARDR